MNLTSTLITFRRALVTMSILLVALLAMVAALTACGKSAPALQSASSATPQSINPLIPQRVNDPAPAPTAATTTVPEPEFPLSLTTAPVVTRGGESFESVYDHDTGKYHLILNPCAQVIIEPADYRLSVEDQRDFNGDGINDALISFHGGGNCCPPVYAFLTVYKGKAFISALNDDWGEFSVTERREYLVVAHKHLEATDYWRLKGTTATKVGSKPKLKAFAEIRGVGAHYMGPEDKTITLRVDMDDDGIIDQITCGIWVRWGSLIGCELPLPGSASQTLNLSCDRLGALKTLRNGMHELVCGNDTVIYFDGKSWRTNKESLSRP